MAKRAVNNASRKNWAGLWPALGLTGIGTLYIAKEQLDDPGSFPNTVATRVMAGMQAAHTRMGIAAEHLAQKMLHKLQPPPITPPAMRQLPSPASIPGHTARWLADWVEGSPERAEVAVTLGGAPLMSWLLDLTCSDDEVDSVEWKVFGGNSWVKHPEGPPAGGAEGAGGHGGGGGARWRDSSEEAEALHAERALASLLQSDAAMAVLVSRAGALPRIIRHAASGNASPALVRSLAARASAGLVTTSASPPPSLFAAAAAAAASATGAATPAKPQNQQQQGLQQGQQGQPARPPQAATVGARRAGEAGGSYLEASLKDLEELIAMLKASGPPPLTLSTSVWDDDTKAVEGLVSEQCLAAAFLAAWAEEGGPNLAKLLGAGLTTALAEVVDDVTASWPCRGRGGEGGGEGLGAPHPPPSPNAPEPGGVIGGGAHSGGGADGGADGVWPLDLPWQLVRVVAALAPPSPARSGVDPITTEVSHAREVPWGAGRVQGGGRSCKLGSTDPPPAHHLAACVQPLLYVAAGAAVEGEEGLAARALHTLRSALDAGGEPVRAAVAAANTLPLLRELTNGPGPWLQVEVAGAVEGLARTGVLSSSAEDVAFWRTWALARVLGEGGSDGGGGGGKAPGGSGAIMTGEEAQCVRDSCVSALSALASLPGTPGLQVGYHWLAALLAALGRRVWPYNAMVYTGPQLEGGGDILAPPPSSITAAAQASGSVGSVTGSDSEKVLRALDLLDAVPVLPSHIQSVASALEAASDAVDASDVLEPPPHFDPGGGAGRLNASFAVRPARPKPRRQAPPSRAVGEDHSAAAATSQLGSVMGAAGEGGDGGAASSVHRMAVHMVEVLAAQQRVCDALEVLSALVSADPAKQAWLMDVGVLPLLAHLTTHTATTFPTASSAAARHAAAAAAAAAGGAASAAAMATPSGAAAAAAAHAAALAADVYTDHDGPAQLCVKRQVARLLTMLALQPAGRDPVKGVASPGWMSWLTCAAASDDCRLASHATKALLNMEALRAREDWDRYVHSPPAPLFLDMVYLLDPGAPHHWTLARDGSRPHHSTPFLPRLDSGPAGEVTSAVAAAATLGAQGDASGVSQDVPAATTHGVSMASMQAANMAGSSSVANGEHGQPQQVRDKAAPPTTVLAGAAPTRAVPSEAAQWAGDGAAVSEVVSLVSSLGNLLYRIPGSLGTASASALPPTPPSSPSTPSLSHDTPLPSSQSWSQPTIPGLHNHTTQGESTNLGKLVSSAATAQEASFSAHPQAPQPAHSSPQPQSSAAAAVAASGEKGGAPTRHPSPQTGAQHQPLQHPSPPTTQPAPAAAAAATATASPASPAPAAAASAGGVDARRAQAPEVDVVFIHGIRGGPFITWRKPGVQKPAGPRVASRRWLSRDHVWPAAWLPADFPTARLLSVEYLAPLSGWEGESLPLEATVVRVMDELVAAGVGQRPVVFVAHSMGGLLVKEMIVRSLKEGRVLEQEAQERRQQSQHHSAPLPPPSPSTAAADVTTATAATATANSQELSQPSTQQPPSSPAGSFMSPPGVDRTPSPHPAAPAPHPVNPSPAAAALATASMAAAAESLATPGSSPAAASVPWGGATQGRAALAEATRGVVFFATPHRGSQLAAVGWKLRHVPYASPAPSLAKLTPGPHLEALDSVLQSLHDSGRVRVTSAAEGAPTRLSPVLKLLVVPPESAYPGYGDFLSLSDQDHISVCKPPNPQAPSYVAVAQCLASVLDEARKQGQGQGQSEGQGTEQGERVATREAGSKDCGSGGGGGVEHKDDGGGCGAGGSGAEE